MHEASMAAGILRIVCAEAAKHNATRIVGIRLDVGLLACVEAHTLAACFEMMAEGTAADGARLTLRTTPLPCTCRQCNHAFLLEKRHFVCPQCGGIEVDFTGGHGCQIAAIDVASEE